MCWFSKKPAPSLTELNRTSQSEPFSLSLSPATGLSDGGFSQGGSNGEAPMTAGGVAAQVSSAGLRCIGRRTNGGVTVFLRNLARRVSSAADPASTGVPTSGLTSVGSPMVDPASAGVLAADPSAAVGGTTLAVVYPSFLFM